MSVAKKLKVLEKARKTYGNNMQILVSIEELLELACVLVKYPRYIDEGRAKSDLRDKAIDEIADVVIIFDHVQRILDIDDKSVAKRITKKVNRLSRWLKHSNSTQETIDDRRIEEENCSNCQNQKFFDICHTCMSAQGTEGKKPYYKSKE